MTNTSPHAAVAKLIRADLKKRVIKASVTSESYYGGDAVRISLTDQPPSVARELKKQYSCYVYGEFNGMEDIYEFTNRRHDIPQVKFLFVESSRSPEMRGKIKEFIATNPPCLRYEEEMKKSHRAYFCDDFWQWLGLAAA